jgi:uncharacterized protein
MVKYLICYLILLNFIGFLSMYIDKEKAKKGKWRIKESTLLLIAIIGGSIGSYLGMKTFRHKTNHAKFKYGIPLIIIIQLVIYFYFGNNLFAIPK